MSVELKHPRDPLAVVSLGVSLLASLLVVVAFFQAPSKELELRLRVMEVAVSAMQQDLAWIKESQKRVEDRVSRRIVEKERMGWPESQTSSPSSH